MKIMIFGDVASGKSTFALRLGEQTGLPVIHLDEIMTKVGRLNKEDIFKIIEDEVHKPHWIIEGNAFTKDKAARIAAADEIIVFDFNRFVSLKNHIVRSMRVRQRKEMARGGVSGTINLRYYVPYILWQFPGRKKDALKLARKNRKVVIRFKNRKQARAYLVSTA